ncbi:MAG TPA: bifunctional UDP-N-acetylglucosamine diphosphorylase/glucosamine-1-phosphate N-acetyltransferase GlmU [Thermomicrobiales bacterium]|nr:bifunctional UDP-N-acetylglucosamine diphosphorylase/glucosamine-1-phosphate N-acetyltransferase GlmU [Thermomicrobiales bacterium]
MTITDDQPAADHLPSPVLLTVLAAGGGTRMRSRVPKPLHAVAGVPMVQRVLQAGAAVDPHQTIVVINPTMREQLERASWIGPAVLVEQPETKGTGDAVARALGNARHEAIAVVLYADHPLLTGEVVRRLVMGARQSAARVTVLSCLVEDAAGYGRIERNEVGAVSRIVERADDEVAARQGVTEINSGMMALDVAWAREALTRVEPSGTTGELYLTDLVELAVRGHRSGEPWPVASVQASPEVALGINDRQQLREAEAVLWERKRREVLAAGVSLIGADTIFIDGDVEIGQDTLIFPFTILRAGTRIGGDCRIGPHATLDQTVLGDGVTVQASTLTRVRVGDGADIGPYAHLRAGTVIGEGAHIGNYAEIKNATIGTRSKVGHFSYVGDARVGDGANIGAGVVTANFDGTAKHRTDIGDGAFIGSNTVLRAPVRVGVEAVTGAGSVVTKDVPDGATAVGVPARIIKRGTQADDSPGGKT